MNPPWLTTSIRNGSPSPSASPSAVIASNMSENTYENTSYWWTACEFTRGPAKLLFGGVLQESALNRLQEASRPRPQVLRCLLYWEATLGVPALRNVCMKQG